MVRCVVVRSTCVCLMPQAFGPSAPCCFRTRCPSAREKLQTLLSLIIEWRSRYEYGFKGSAPSVYLAAPYTNRDPGRALLRKHLCSKHLKYSIRMMRPAVPIGDLSVSSMTPRWETILHVARSGWDYGPSTRLGVSSASG